MPFNLRPRRLFRAALTVAVAVFVTACAQEHPNSIFTANTDFNREVIGLFDMIIWAGTAVFIFVEVLLVVALVKFRKREGQKEPQNVHGNAKLEIMWTIIPAVILALIAIPTVRTIFSTQAPARADALQVDVTGHQWWWEFHYPEYDVTTANELYLPVGRTVNFRLRSADVIHSFWIPELGGKRDVMPRAGKTARPNYLWFTPDSVSSTAFNGFCAEYCGDSHANMRFRVFTVTPEQFQSWVAHQKTAAAFQVAAAGVTASVAPDSSSDAASAPVVQAGFIAFPAEEMPAATVPSTPIPAGMTFDESLVGDPTRGATMMTRGIGACLGCHTITGNPSMMGKIGPNLTHIASRHTIAAGLYPNDKLHLSLWIKNARVMKPGVTMPTLGLGQHDPVLNSTMKTGGLTDQQIADIVAYLQSLK